MGKRPRGRGAEVDRISDAATTTVDFLNHLNRNWLYHPADGAGEPCLPLGYSEFDIFKADGEGRPGRYFKIAHSSSGGPGLSATWVRGGQGEFGPPAQWELLNTLNLADHSEWEGSATFRVPGDFQLSKAAPFDELRDAGLFTADEDVHLLQHKEVELAELCRQLSQLDGRRTGEAMQLIALCMMMGMSHLLVPGGPMRKVLSQLLSDDKWTLDGDTLGQIKLRYHQWQVPVFDTAQLLDAHQKPVRSFETLATLFTFAKAPEDEMQERALLRAIPTNLVAAVQRFTDACAGRDNSHFGNERDAVVRTVEYMAQETQDPDNLFRWAKERDARAEDSAGSSHIAKHAAEAIVDAFLKKEGLGDGKQSARDVMVQLFFWSSYWRTLEHRLSVVERFRRHSPGHGPALNIETVDKTAGSKV